ncbi:hypothetical protein EJB05_04100, partial [Eragrostis curvula]
LFDSSVILADADLASTGAAAIATSKTSNGRDVRVSLCRLGPPPSTSWVQLYTDDEVSTNPTIVSADGDHLLIHMIVAIKGMFKAKYPHNFFVYRADLDRPCLWPLPPPSGLITRSDHTGIARNGEGFVVANFSNCFVVDEATMSEVEVAVLWIYRTVSNCRGHLLFVDVNNGRDNRCVIRDDDSSRCSITTWTLRMPELEWELDTTLLLIQDLWSSRSYRDSHLPRTVPTFPVVSLREANVVYFVVKDDEPGYYVMAWVVTVDMEKKSLERHELYRNPVKGSGIDITNVFLDHPLVAAAMSSNLSLDVSEQNSIAAGAGKHISCTVLDTTTSVPQGETKFHYVFQ